MNYSCTLLQVCRVENNNYSLNAPLVFIPLLFFICVLGLCRVNWMSVQPKNSFQHFSSPSHTHKVNTVRYKDQMQALHEYFAAPSSLMRIQQSANTWSSHAVTSVVKCVTISFPSLFLVPNFLSARTKFTLLASHL